jgi:hypothetical protein
VRRNSFDWADPVFITKSSPRGCSVVYSIVRGRGFSNTIFLKTVAILRMPSPVDGTPSVTTPRVGPFSQSGLLKVGIEKSDAKTRVVLPPLVGVTVPESTRMASGSPCLLCSTYTSLAPQS